MKEFYSGSPADLVRLAKEAYVIIKRVDPRALVVSPSATSGASGIRWLDQYLSLGGAQYADVIGFHFYVSPRSPESALPIVLEVKQLLRKHGVKRPLWNTEAGWIIENANEVADPAVARSARNIVPLGPNAAASYLARFMVLLWTAGVDRNYWYAWDNQAMGLIEPTTKQVKPVAKAYARIIAWLRDGVVEECMLRPVGIWSCTVVHSQGGKSRILWSPTSNLRWQVPPSWLANEYQTLDGPVRRMPTNGVLELGSSPVLVSAPAK